MSVGNGISETHLAFNRESNVVITVFRLPCLACLQGQLFCADYADYSDLSLLLVDFSGGSQK